MNTKTKRILTYLSIFVSAGFLFFMIIFFATNHGPEGPEDDKCTKCINGKKCSGKSPENCTGDCINIPLLSGQGSYKCINSNCLSCCSDIKDTQIDRRQDFMSCLMSKKVCVRGGDNKVQENLIFCTDDSDCPGNECKFLSEIAGSPPPSNESCNYETCTSYDEADCNKKKGCQWFPADNMWGSGFCINPIANPTCCEKLTPTEFEKDAVCFVTMNAAANKPEPSPPLNKPDLQ